MNILVFLVALQGVPTARLSFEDGRRAYNVGDFAGAATAFERAYRLSGDPILLHNLGQAHRQAGNVKEAAAAYRAYLRELPSAPNRRVVEARIAEMERSRPPQPPPAAKADLVEPSSPAPKIRTIQNVAPAPRRQWLPWGTAGAAAALGGAAAVTAILAQRRFSELQGSCGRTPGGCPEAEIDGLKRRALAVNLLLSLAAASAMTTGLLIYADAKGGGITVGVTF